MNSDTSPEYNANMNGSPISSINDDRSAKLSTMSSKFPFLNADSLDHHLRRLQKKSQRGRIELIMGPMFAGKSTELLRRVNRLEISGKKCLSVKFSGDQRYSIGSISTHDLITRNARSCTKLAELGDEWRDHQVIGIDEGQFFEDLVQFCQTAANAGKIVVISALNGMYTQKGFPVILELIPLCETVKKLTACCKLCGNDASYTYRTVQTNSNAEILIGGAESYMPLCRECLGFMKSENDEQRSTCKNQVLYSEPSDITTANGSGSKDTPLLDVEHTKFKGDKTSGTPEREIRKYSSDLETSLRQ